jgi:hypothetical protein
MEKRQQLSPKLTLSDLSTSIVNIQSLSIDYAYLFATAKREMQAVFEYMICDFGVSRK